MVIQAIEFDVVGVPAQNGRMTDTNETTKQPKKPSSVPYTGYSTRSQQAAGRGTAG